MIPPDPLTLLERADPAERIDLDPAPPEDVLAGIVTARPAVRGRPRRRRALRLVPVGFALAAAVAVLGALLVGDGDVDVAEKAYAATSPAAGILYTEMTLELSTPVATDAGHDHDRSHVRSWQQGDRAHVIRTELDENGRPKRLPASVGSQPWVYESVQDGDVLHMLTPKGRVDTVRERDGAEATEILADGRRSIVERFRARFVGAELRDAGETTFAGRPARAYEVNGRPHARETYYLDPESGLPLGAVSVFGHANGPDGPESKPSRNVRLTETVLRFERLPATPANLAKLEAPAVEAAASRR